MHRKAQAAILNKSISVWFLNQHFQWSYTQDKDYSLFPIVGPGTGQNSSRKEVHHPSGVLVNMQSGSQGVATCGPHAFRLGILSALQQTCPWSYWYSVPGSGGWLLLILQSRIVLRQRCWLELDSINDYEIYQKMYHDGTLKNLISIPSFSE